MLMIYDDFYGDIDGFTGATEHIGTGGVDNIFVILMSVYLIVIGVALIVALADYLLRGFGMYKIGKAEGRTNCWLAFVPFARTYFQGELGGPIPLKQKTIKNPGIWLVIIPIITGMVAAVGYFIFLMVTMFGFITSSGYRSVQHAATGMVSGFLVFLIVVIVGATVYQAVIHVLYVLVNHQIYERYTSKNMAIVHAVLGTLIPLYQSICFFIFGRRAEQATEEPEQPGYQEPTMEQPIYHEPIVEEPKQTDDKME